MCFSLKKQWKYKVGRRHLKMLSKNKQDKIKVIKDSGVQKHMNS